MHYLILLAIPFLAFCYRARGGSIPLGSDTLARIIFWAAPVGLVTDAVAVVGGYSPWLALPCAVLAFAGATIPHADEQGPTAFEHEGMGLITTAMLSLILLPFIVAGAYTHEHVLTFLYAFMGALGGAAYYICYRFPFSLKLLGVQWVTAGDASAGEFLTGGLAFGLPLAILGISA